jgi:hypothetical protein
VQARVQQPDFRRLWQEQPSWRRQRDPSHGQVPHWWLTERQSPRRRLGVHWSPRSVSSRQCTTIQTLYTRRGVRILLSTRERLIPRSLKRPQGRTARPCSRSSSRHGLRSGIGHIFPNLAILERPLWIPTRNEFMIQQFARCRSIFRVESEALDIQEIERGVVEINIVRQRRFRPFEQLSH